MCAQLYEKHVSGSSVAEKACNGWSAKPSHVPVSLLVVAHLWLLLKIIVANRRVQPSEDPSSFVFLCHHGPLYRNGLTSILIVPHGLPPALLV